MKTRWGWVDEGGSGGDDTRKNLSTYELKSFRNQPPKNRGEIVENRFDGGPNEAERVVVIQ